jgi:hypothetical protein
MCGHDSFLPPNRKLALVVINEDMSLNMSKAFIVSAYVCENCAWVSLHAPGVLYPRDSR